MLKNYLRKLLGIEKLEAKVSHLQDQLDSDIYSNMKTTMEQKIARTVIKLEKTIVEQYENIKHIVDFNMSCDKYSIKGTMLVRYFGMREDSYVIYSNDITITGEKAKGLYELADKMFRVMSINKDVHQLVNGEK
ncbi:MAG: hypothetical protein J6T10_29850 [Methanobrevibacter sp.]|nr:hypothetical protein [Methanobrevibacter sp.]